MATLFPRFGTQCKLCFNFKQFKRAAMSPWGAQLFFNNCACHVDAIAQDKIQACDKPKPHHMPKKAHTGEGVTMKICILNLVHLVTLI